MFYLKYVDDTLAASICDDPLDNSLQAAADSLISWCNSNGMVVNWGKTKEMLVYFGKMFSDSFVPRIAVNGSHIERVSTFKLLGVMFSNDLSWACHVSFMLQKVSKRFFIIYQLSRVGLSSKDIVAVYCSVVRSVLEYACVVWHPGLTSSESADIERVQKRVLRVIFPSLDYQQALIAAGLERLDVRRENMTRDMFKEIKNPSHILHSLLPVRVPGRSTRTTYPYELPRHRTDRFLKSFFSYCISKQF